MHVNLEPTGLAATYTLARVPDGIAGVKATLKVMAALVREARRLPAIRETALFLTQGLEQKNWFGEISALHRFVRDEIRYVRDIRDVETLHDPAFVLENRFGDCDDKSMLLASLLESVGHPARFVAVGFEPGDLSHVYVETRLGTGWLPLETTEYVEPGWEPENVKNRIVFNI